MARVILHCDANSFYCSCELCYRPELRHLPVAVGGDAVAFRPYTVEQGHVAGQGHGRHYGAGLHGGPGLADELFDIGIAAGGQGIGTHAVHQDELYLGHGKTLLCI